MIQPPQITDEHVQLAINVLEVQEGAYFTKFVNMLRNWLQIHRLYGDTAEDVDMYRNQGAIQILDHLIKEIEGNRNRYNKMREQR